MMAYAGPNLAISIMTLNGCCSYSTSKEYVLDHSILLNSVRF